MNQDLYRLVYSSRNQIPGDDDACAREIRNILKVARVNNLKAKITGALLFNAGSFGQVLEGPRGAIEATFEHIQCDPRHSDVALLGLDMVANRVFENWSMAYTGADRIEGSRFGDIAVETDFDPTKMTADRILQTLSRLTLEEEGNKTMVPPILS
jgi:hypothetical protein